MGDATTRFTFRLKPDLKSALKQQGDQHGRTLTEHINLILEDAVRHEAELPGVTYLTPEIKKVLAHYMKKWDERFTRLLARNAIETSATKRLLLHLLIVGDYASEDEADALEKEAWRLSRNNLYSPIQSLEELVQDIRDQRSR